MSFLLSMDDAWPHVLPHSSGTLYTTSQATALPLTPPNSNGAFSVEARVFFPVMSSFPHWNAKTPSTPHPLHKSSNRSVSDNSIQTTATPTSTASSPSTPNACRSLYYQFAADGFSTPAGTSPHNTPNPWTEPETKPQTLPGGNRGEAQEFPGENKMSRKVAQKEQHYKSPDPTIFRMQPRLHAIHKTTFNASSPPRALNSFETPLSDGQSVLNVPSVLSYDSCVYEQAFPSNENPALANASGCNAHRAASFTPIIRQLEGTLEANGSREVCYNNGTAFVLGGDAADSDVLHDVEAYCSLGYTPKSHLWNTRNGLRNSFQRSSYPISFDASNTLDEKQQQENSPLSVNSAVEYALQEGNSLIDLYAASANAKRFPLVRETQAIASHASMIKSEAKELINFPSLSGGRCETVPCTAFSRHNEPQLCNPQDAFAGNCYKRARVDTTTEIRNQWNFDETRNVLLQREVLKSVQKATAISGHKSITFNTSDTFSDTLDLSAGVFCFPQRATISASATDSLSFDEHRSSGRHSCPVTGVHFTKGKSMWRAQWAAHNSNKQRESMGFSVKKYGFWLSEACAIVVRLAGGNSPEGIDKMKLLMEKFNNSYFIENKKSGNKVLPPRASPASEQCELELDLHNLLDLLSDPRTFIMAIEDYIHREPRRKKESFTITEMLSITCSFKNCM